MNEATQADVQDIYDYLLAEASRALALGGSFAPFAAALRDDRERLHVNVDAPVAETAPDEHVARLIVTMRAGAERLLVAGLAFDGSVTTDLGAEDALVLHIEHRGGEGIEVFVPYGRDGGEGAVTFKDPILQAVHTDIFPERE